MSDFPMTHDENDDPSPASDFKPVTKHTFWHNADEWTITRTGISSATLDGPPGRDPVPAALHEVLASRSEIARLRSELTHQSALWQTALGHAAEQDAEIKRLRADERGIQAMARLNKKLTDQRDALADALERHLYAQYGKTTAEIAAGWNDLYSDSPSFAAAGPSIAALRLAGRLPQEKS